MKLQKMKIALLGFALSATFVVQSQKSNVVSAAMEYQKYPKALMTQNYEEAKKLLLSAKDFIDPAMKDESTKNDEKAHYYNGVIHYSLIELSSIPGNEDLQAYQSEETMEMIKKSLKIANESRKFKRDVQDFVNQKVQQASNIGTMMFEQEKFDYAFAGFAGAYEIQKMIDVEDKDMRNNAIVSAQNAINKMKDDGKTEEAIKFAEQVTEMFPKSMEIAIQGVNLSLDKGDLVKAESFFDKAIQADPENEILFTSMGSIFLLNGDELSSQLKTMELRDPNYAQTAENVESMYNKAEKNLKKALELNPKHRDAAYNLGVLYLGKGEKLTMEANQMDFNDPRYDEVLKQSEDMYKKAIDPFEMYIEEEPNNAGVLNVLFQVHRKAGNTEKALEYKKRAEEAAN